MINGTWYKVCFRANTGHSSERAGLRFAATSVYWGAGGPGGILWLVATGPFSPVPGCDCEDEADHGEDEKHPLDEVLVGRQDVERLGGDGKDDAEHAPEPPTLQNPLSPNWCVSEIGNMPLCRGSFRPGPSPLATKRNVRCLPESPPQTAGAPASLPGRKQTYGRGLLFRGPFALAPAVQPIGVLGRGTRQVPGHNLGCEPQGQNQKTQAEQVRHARDCTRKHAASQDESLRRFQNPFPDRSRLQFCGAANRRG